MDEECLCDLAGLDRVLENSPRINPSRFRSRPTSCTMARKAARSVGSIVYSLIARIGPSSSATRLRKHGARELIDGVRIQRGTCLQLPSPGEKHPDER